MPTLFSFSSYEIIQCKILNMCYALYKKYIYVNGVDSIWLYTPFLIELLI